MSKQMSWHLEWKQALVLQKKFPTWFQRLKTCTQYQSRPLSDFHLNWFYPALISCVCSSIISPCLNILNDKVVLGSIALAAGNSTESYKQPKIEEMNYVLLTESENISIPITDSTMLWKHEKFDAKKKTVIMVTGWTSDIKDENTAASALWEAYKSRGDTNFVLIDTARYVDTLYAWSAFNTQELGKGLGKGIAQLINVVPLESIHLMGHSLGYVTIKLKHRPAS